MSDELDGMTLIAGRTTREDSRAVPCPTCGVPAGEPCEREEAQRPSKAGASHAARHKDAIAAGAPLVYAEYARRRIRVAA